MSDRKADAGHHTAMEKVLVLKRLVSFEGITKSKNKQKIVVNTKLFISYLMCSSIHVKFIYAIKIKDSQGLRPVKVNGKQPMQNQS